MYRAQYKVPGGKLVKVSVTLLDDTIQYVQFTGDFFLHPETVLADLEKFLVGKKGDETALSEHIDAFFREHAVQVIGCSAQDFAHVIIMAISSHASVS
ncbi:MAG: lipoate protein ligase C-terminal domain-containing protein [Candidatus Thorarchaeota archaeon]